MLPGSKEIHMMKLISNLLGRRSKPLAGSSVNGSRRRVQPCVEALEERLVMTTGYLDPTFGPDHNGIVRTNVDTKMDGANCSTFQSDGKIVVAGYAGSGLGGGVAVARYSKDGFLDPTFGHLGATTVSFGLPHTEANSVVVQSDGKIVVAGYIGADGINEWLLMRFDADGSIDNTFGNGGLVLTEIDHIANCRASSLALQPDGKIVVAGTAGGAGILARYQTDGSLDTMFGKNGEVVTFLGGDPKASFHLAIQADGKIVAAGEDHSHFGLTRYNADGTLDTTFGPNHQGRVDTSFNGGTDVPASLVLVKDKIVVAGAVNVGGNEDFGMARYSADGSLDTTFGPNHSGKVATDFGADAGATSVTLQANGDLVVGGAAQVYGTSGFALARYQSNGNLDTSFCGTGTLTFGIDWDDYSNSVLVQADGKVVAAGHAGFTQYDGDIALVRIDPSAWQFPFVNVNFLTNPGPQSIDWPPPTHWLGGPDTVYVSTHVLAPAASATASLRGAAPVQHEAQGATLAVSKSRISQTVPAPTLALDLIFSGLDMGQV
jgi:uncharacterized delta-60 repeat protein